MLLLGASPSDRGILAATLAVAGAAIMALTSGYPDSVGRLLSDAPATSSTVGDQRGLALYFLIEAARPLPLFGR